MNEKIIVYETKNFWCRQTKDNIEVNLKVEVHSYRIGEKETLDEAKAFVDKLELYPENIKLLLPKKLRYQIKK